MIYLWNILSVYDIFMEHFLKTLVLVSRKELLPDFYTKIVFQPILEIQNIKKEIKKQT